MIRCGLALDAVALEPDDAVAPLFRPALSASSAECPVAVRVPAARRRLGPLSATLRADSGSAGWSFSIDVWFSHVYSGFE